MNGAMAMAIAVGMASATLALPHAHLSAQVTPPAQAAAPAASTEAPRTYWLIVSGLSGEAEYATSYSAIAGKIATAARQRFGATQAWWLAETERDGVAGTSTKANIEAKLREVAGQSTSSDALFVILIGHGSSSDGVARIGLPGPDLTATELAQWLSAVPARATIINTSSASGAWLVPLASKGRVVITATKSGVEQNETTFAQYFADALTLEAADTDKDERVSVLEAYDYAKREVERAYSADKKMLTEHAQIDGDGDGKAVPTAALDSPDGAIAALTHFGMTGRKTTAAGTAIVQSPALRSLYAEKASLERELADLRAHKAEIPDADYQARLEKLLTSIAVNGQSIRKLEGVK